VKKRTYYGNTSMEAEISLLMANQTLVCPLPQIATATEIKVNDLHQAAPGKFIYDPFMGTGSTAYVRL
jgi:tRNA (guanine10-N2)-methyltransferase